MKETVSVCFFSDWIGLSSVLRPHQHSKVYTRNCFYRSKDPTNSIKVLFWTQCKCWPNGEHCQRYQRIMVSMSSGYWLVIFFCRLIFYIFLYFIFYIF